MTSRAAENSLEAVRECYLAGGGAIDCDVRETLDGVVVTLHDAAPGGGLSLYPVSALTCREVSEIDLDRAYPGQKIPRFEDVLRLAMANNLGVYLDAKERGAMEKALALMERYRAEHLRLWPVWHMVYHYSERRDDDLAHLQACLGECTGTMRYIVGAPRGETRQLKPGDPRHLRCDNPLLIAALAGRILPADTTRGPFRPPVPEIPDPNRPERPTFDSLVSAWKARTPSPRLATSRLCEAEKDKALAFLLTMLRKGEGLPVDEQVECLWGLGQLGDAVGLKPLRAKMTSREARVREVSAYGLGRLRDAASSDLLQTAAQDGDRKVANAARWALDRIKTRKPRGKGGLSLQQVAQLVRQNGSEATWQLLDPPGVVAHLESLLKGADLTAAHKSRMVVVLALREDIEACVPLLRLLAQDAHATVARHAQWALGYVQKRLQARRPTGQTFPLGGTGCAGPATFGRRLVGQRSGR